MATLFLRTMEQVVLFEHELKGQISDGHWENAGPRDHWQDWCRCRVAVVPEGTQPGRNFFPRRDRYGLTSPQLLDVVGGRMVMYVRLYQGLGLQAVEDLKNRVGCPDACKAEPIEVPGNDLEGAYWNEQRAVLKRYDLDIVNRFLIEGPYDKRDLLRDLREISAAMQNRVDTQDPPEPPKVEKPVRFYGHDVLAHAVERLTGLKAKLLGRREEFSVWYNLETSTGMFVGSFSCASREDGTWVVGSCGIPNPEDGKKVELLGF